VDTYKTIGQYVKARREELGVNQEELAKRIGVTPTTISLYESGKRKPDLDTLKQIATVLKTSLAFLLDIEVPKQGLDIALRANNLDNEEIDQVKHYIQLLKYAKRAKNAEQSRNKTNL
jgi:transcriptional regulator with XRE-family HTH domain